VNDAPLELKRNPRAEKGENGGGFGKAGDIAPAAYRGLTMPGLK